MLSSVSFTADWARRHLGLAPAAVYELNADTPLPFINTYTTPQTLGKDRLAAVAGAWALFPGAHSLVIDCGTCIKYDLMSAEGRYLGGNIAPGVSMRTQAMHHFTARLPIVPLEWPQNPIGNSTQTALQNGAFLGAAAEITGMTQTLSAAAEWMHFQTILTGGDADFLLPHLPIQPIHIQPHLVLYGLKAILKHQIG